MKISNDKLYDKTWLEHEYLDELKTTIDIAEELGIDANIVSRFFRRYKIPRRSLTEDRRLRIMKKENYLKLNNKEWMYTAYVTNERSSIDIMRELNISYSIITNVLRQHGIPLRSINECQHISSMSKSIRDKLDNKEWLFEEYCNKARSLRSIGRELKVKSDTVKRSLIRNDIDIIVRDNCYWMARDRNPQWRGGITVEYCIKFNEKFKESIREKFNRICFECDIHESKPKLHVHHIDYNKNSICNGKDWAFIPLCGKCHNKTHIRRWHWFNKYIYYWVMNNNINFMCDCTCFIIDI